MPPGSVGWICWALLGLSPFLEEVFRIARAHETGFSSPAMASVVRGVERCQALQPQVPTMNLSPLILEETLLEF